MPKDYDYDQGAVSGLKAGKTAGKIAGAPEGLGDASSGTGPWKYADSGDGPGAGHIRGTPVGIEGAIRTAVSEERRAAIGRRLGRR